MEELKLQDSLFKPNCTQVPNVILDQILSRIPDAEGRCLWYLCRRTFGFHKTKDRISLSQFVSGVKDSAGVQLDYGTGLTKKSIIYALKNLESSGILKTERTTNDKYYELDVDMSQERIESVVGSINRVQNETGVVATLPINRCSSYTTPSVVATPEVVSQLHRQNNSRKIEKNRTDSAEAPSEVLKTENSGDIKSDFDQILEYYSLQILPLRIKKSGKGFDITTTVRTMLKDRLSEFSVQEIKSAIDCFALDEFYKKQNYLGLKWFLNHDTLEKLLNKSLSMGSSDDYKIREYLQRNEMQPEDLYSEKSTCGLDLIVFSKAKATGNLVEVKRQYILDQINNPKMSEFDKLQAKMKSVFTPENIAWSEKRYNATKKKYVSSNPPANTI